MDIKKLLELALKNNASDLHILFGIAPTLRINGELEPITGKTSFEKSEIKEAILSLLDENQKKIFLEKKELDFSFEFERGTRFRVNAYHAQGSVAASFRLIKPRIPTIEELNLPEMLRRFTELRQGFVLVVGPTGHGKSTTVAVILEEINKNRKVHIVSIEDPIEYVLQAKRSIISQREIGGDSLSFQNALRSCLREDPDVVFVGEMRDLETIALALTIAETGHLVFSTLHTNSSAQTIDRIIDVFPEGAKGQIKLQLASVLGAVISQRLIPSLNKDQLFPAVEILLSNPAIRTAIREGKTYMIDNVIQTSLEAGMVTLERSLAVLVRQGKIDLEAAQSFALRPEDLNRQLRQEKTKG